MLFRGHKMGLAVGRTVGINEGRAVRIAEGRDDGEKDGLAEGPDDGSGDGRVVGSLVGKGVAVKMQRRAAPTPPFEVKPGAQVQIDEPGPDTLFAGHETH
jgi:hypothetical protein